MSNVQLQQSVEFEIKELSITTKQFGTIDIRGMYDELNIHDSLLQPCLTGNILILDAVGLSNKLKFDGSEYLNVSIAKTKNFLGIEKTFHIYKQSNRNIINQTSESFILHFSSEEFVYSEQQIVNQSYDSTYSTVVKKILIDYLKIPNNKLSKGVFESSQGTRSVTIPNLKPFDVINWCAKRALDKNGLPNYLFFENVHGYNFSTVATLMKQPSLFNVNFSVKNYTDNIKDEMLGVRAYEVVNQFDYIDNTRAGVYSGTFVGFDTLTRTYIKKKITFDDVYDKVKHENKNPKKSSFVNREKKLDTQMYDSRRVVFPFALNRANTAYIQENDGKSVQVQETPEKWYFQRLSLMQNLMAQRLKMVLPGNFGLTSGVPLNVMAPIRGETGVNESAMDLSLYGKYLVVATRHIIKYDRHETIVEVVTDSTNQPLVPVATNKLAVNSSEKSWLGGNK